MLGAVMRDGLSPPELLAAYSRGIFPMAHEGRINWFAPDPRAILPLDDFRIARSLRTTIRRGVYAVTVNRAFEAVIDACADRPDGTWISQEIRAAYIQLHHRGFAHSVEAWKDEQLAGGLYGVAIGGAFFGESMFHRSPDASKVALAHLVERMKRRGMVLLDIQFMTEHLRQFGAIEVRRSKYEEMLKQAIALPVSFLDPGEPGDSISNDGP